MANNVLVLGRVGSGKTTLIKAIMGRDLNEEKSAIEKVINDDLLGGQSLKLISVAADPLKIRGESICEPFGLETLVKRTLEIFKGVQAA